MDREENSTNPEPEKEPSATFVREARLRGELMSRRSKKPPASAIIGAVVALVACIAVIAIAVLVVGAN